MGLRCPRRYKRSPHLPSRKRKWHHLLHLPFPSSSWLQSHWLCDQEDIQNHKEEEDDDEDKETSEEEDREEEEEETKQNRNQQERNDSDSENGSDQHGGDTAAATKSANKKSRVYTYAVNNNHQQSQGVEQTYEEDEATVASAQLPTHAPLAIWTKMEESMKQVKVEQSAVHDYVAN